jgi:hypothetical protein
MENTHYLHCTTRYLRYRSYPLPGLVFRWYLERALHDPGCGLGGDFVAIIRVNGGNKYFYIDITDLQHDIGHLSNKTGIK